MSTNDPSCKELPTKDELKALYNKLKDIPGVGKEEEGETELGSIKVGILGIKHGLKNLGRSIKHNLRQAAISEQCEMIAEKELEEQKKARMKEIEAELRGQERKYPCP